MNLLTKSLISELVGDNIVTALYGGGFKPPTKGHFEVVQKALTEFPEIDKFIIYVGSGERNGITQAESLLIWEIYKKYLGDKVEIQPSKAPIGDIIRYGKSHPEEVVYFVIGARDGNEGDLQDVALRTSGVEDKYPNVKIKVIQTPDAGISGTKAREASKKSPEAFYKFLPPVINDNERLEIFGYIQDVVTEIVTDTEVICDGCGWEWSIVDGGDDLYMCHKCGHDNSPKQLNENASYSKDIDVKEKILELTKHMLAKGMNIKPLPKVKFVNGDSNNAREFLGKTAYYDPNNFTITLYTEGRHPKDIVRSFSHEMIHHIQNLENRLGDVSTTNTMEDDNIDKLEQEANLKGTMTFRNWTDSLNENLTKNSNYLYHWTSYLACKKIIESNKLKSNRANQFFEYDKSRILSDYENVVFFTEENERFADEENSNQCILVVDKSKLSKDYKTITYGDPYEEIIVYTNDSFIPIFPYLKGVLLMNTLQKSGVKNLVQFLELKNIPYEINDNLEKQTTAKKAMLPTLKKELINKLKSKYPNGFIGYLNSPLKDFQTPEYFKDNSTYSYPNITINKPGEYGEKNKFQVKFKIEPQNLEKYINWFMYSPDSIEDLINMDNYEGEELWLKGNIPIDPTTLQEANLKGTMTFRNWTDSLNEKKNKDPFGLLEGLINETPSEVQVKKINISFELFDGTKISEDITLAMSPNSQGVFELGANIAKYTGLSLKDAQEYNETPDDAYAYGLVNTMNDGQDIYFWTNGTRLAGKAKKAGAQTAIIEQLAHEGVHLTRAILAKSLMGDKFPTGEWPSIGEQDNDTIEEEQLTTALSFVIDQISDPFIEMAKEYIPELNDQSISENLLNEGRYDKITRELTDITINAWKDDEKSGEPIGRVEFEVGPGKDFEYGDLEFIYRGIAVFANIYQYRHNGSATPDKGMVEVDFYIPRSELPKMWEKIYFDLISVIRHEIEHLTQSGKNVKGIVIDKDNPKLNRPGKQMADDNNTRSWLRLHQSTNKGTEYYELEKEVDANLQGLYLKAKKTRTPFDKVVDDYLKYDVKFTPSQIEYVKNVWRPRLKALSLPTMESREKVINESNEQTHQIYCDMDGVLVDFDKQFEKASGGIPPREYEDKNGKEAFWNVINEKGVGFWVGMPWMVNGKQLWDHIKPYNPKLLSAPSRSNESRLGKRLWVKNNIPGTELILAYAENKKNYADGNNILIDDRPSNIDQWKAAGGIGILFISTEQTIKELSKYGL
jgi:hypothetical protein